MRRLSRVATLLAACSGSGEPEQIQTSPLNHDLPGTWTSPVEPTDSGTPTTPEPPELAASCGPTDNALRFECTVSVTAPQPVDITFVREDGLGPTRTHTSELEASDHTIPVYFLNPNTPYEWTVRAADPNLPPVGGTFVTGEVPTGARASFSLNEGMPTSPMIGMVSPCNDGAFAVILDPQSDQVLWYQDFASSPIGFIEAVTFTEDDTVLAIADGVLHEVDLAGNVLLQLSPGVDLPNRVHHDAFRKDGLTYTLFQELVAIGDADFLLDGFYVIDALGTIIAEWHLIDHFVPQGGDLTPFVQDYSHANAIWVDEDENVLISFRHLSAVALIAGEVGAPEFGTITWRLGEATSEFGTDFALTSLVGPPANFERQHNVHFTADKTMMMLDNRIGYTEMSRVLEISVDPPAAEAEILRQFVLPRHCDFQGGAMHTPAGNVLATCAPSRDGYEFDDATGEVRWHGVATCNLSFGSYIPRFIPLDW